MNPRIAAVLAGLAVLPAAVAGQDDFPQLSERVPHFEKRLRSTRWQVRYCLLSNLDGRDAESKRALELLSRDENDMVASQALVRYEKNFIRIDKSLFRPEVYFRASQFLDPPPPSGRALVDRCLLSLRPPAESPEHHEPAMVHAITVVGILGAPEDSAQLERFLDSENDYVLINAAMAVIRLGDKVKGVDALVRLTKRDPAKHLHYVTEALRFLKELEHPEYGRLILDVLSAVDRAEVQPNWANEFILLAAEIDGDVWAPKAASGAAEAGDGK